jgi:hypothetical protein
MLFWWKGTWRWRVSWYDRGDIHVLLESHGETLTDDNLEELVKSSTKEEDSEDSDEPDLPFWTLEKFFNVFSKAQELRDLFNEFDSSMEDTIHDTCGIMTIYNHWRTSLKFSNGKRNSFLLTMFFKKLTKSPKSTLENPQPSTSSAPDIAFTPFEASVSPKSSCMSPSWQILHRGTTCTVWISSFGPSLSSGWKMTISLSHHNLCSVIYHKCFHFMDPVDNTINVTNMKMSTSKAKI